jgi:hypothetical protein
MYPDKSYHKRKHFCWWSFRYISLKWQNSNFYLNAFSCCV